MGASGLPPEDLRNLLRELAEEDASELIAEARRGARARVKELIEEALVEELLHEAIARACRAPASADLSDRPQRIVQAGEAESGDLWWTYCVLDAEHAASVIGQLAGVEPGTGVQVVTENELAALVSPVPIVEYGDQRLREHLEDIDWLALTARRHEAVLDGALQRATIVPLRLCTLYRDVAGVQRLLRENASSLLGALVRVDGCAEWAVKVFADPRSTPASGTEGIHPHEGLASHDQSGAEKPGATYLTRRRRERELADHASEVRANCAQTVHRRVSELARDAKSNPPQRPELHGRELAMLLNGAYLIEREREDELHDVVGTLRADWGPLGFAIELTGPWPGYNFVSGAAGVMP